MPGLNETWSMVMARISGLEKMSFAALTELESQIARLKVEKQNAERAQLREKMGEMARQAGFDVNEIFGKRKGKGSVAPKYRDPKNPENTWTGRGRMPRWLVAATKGNKAKREDFLI
jgi:DNA-binding protein H-NS